VQGRVRLIEPASIEISDLRTYDEGWYECSVVMLDEQTGEQATGEQTTNNGSWVHLTVNGQHLAAAAAASIATYAAVLCAVVACNFSTLQEFYDYCSVLHATIAHETTALAMHVAPCTKVS